jgi:DNA invertase Pin-like site-specific DNA recombinase
MKEVEMVKTTELKSSAKTTGRFIGYVRVSTMHQEDRVSLDAQPAELKRYCKARGFELVKTVSEIESAYKVPFEERPGGKEALAAIRNGEADGIIVVKLDRAFRSTQDAITTVERWGKENVSFVCIDFLNGKPLEQVDDDPMARFTFTLFAGLAQLYRDTVASNTKRALDYKRSQGEWCGRVPFGFKIVDKILVEDPEQMKAIESMKRMHRRGQSVRTIAVKVGVGKSTAHKVITTDLRALKAAVLSCEVYQGYSAQRMVQGDKRGA